MGRRQIEMKPLPGELINVTFKNRIKGLANKAQELGILCNTEVALIAIDPNGEGVHVVSKNGSVADIFQKYLESVKPKAERLQAGHVPPKNLDSSGSTLLSQDSLEMNDQFDPSIGPMQPGLQPCTQPEVQPYMQPGFQPDMHLEGNHFICNVECSHTGNSESNLKCNLECNCQRKLCIQYRNGCSDQKYKMICNKNCYLGCNRCNQPGKVNLEINAKFLNRVRVLFKI